MSRITEVLDAVALTEIAFQSFEGEGDGYEGEGEGEGAGAGDTTPAEGAEPARPPRSQASLEAESARRRARAQRLEGEIADLRKNQMTPEDRAVLDAIRGAGKPPATAPKGPQLPDDLADPMRDHRGFANQILETMNQHPSLTKAEATELVRETIREEHQKATTRTNAAAFLQDPKNAWIASDPEKLSVFVKYSNRIEGSGPNGELIQADYRRASLAAFGDDVIERERSAAAAEAEEDTLEHLERMTGAAPRGTGGTPRGGGAAPDMTTQTPHRIAAYVRNPAVSGTRKTELLTKLSTKDSRKWSEVMTLIDPEFNR